MHREKGSENVWVMDNLVRPNPDLLGDFLPICVLIPDSISEEQIQEAERMGRASAGRLIALLHWGVS